MEPTDLLAVGCKLCHRYSHRNRFQWLLLSVRTVPTECYIPSEHVPDPLYSDGPFRQIFHPKIIFPTEKFTFLIKNSVEKIKFFSSGSERFRKNKWEFLFYVLTLRGRDGALLIVVWVLSLPLPTLVIATFVRLLLFYAWLVAWCCSHVFLAFNI